MGWVFFLCLIKELFVSSPVTEMSDKSRYSSIKHPILQELLKTEISIQSQLSEHIFTEKLLPNVYVQSLPVCSLLAVSILKPQSVSQTSS